MATLARAAYSALLWLATPLYLMRLVWRSRREPLYRAHLAERLGHAGRGVPGGRLWLHAVSLGETRAAAALIDELRRQRPGLRLLLTHGTATGRAAGTPLLREGDAQAWLPYDTPGAVRRFFAAHRPCAGVIMETEIWPNLLHGAASAGVPLVLANARLSERSRRKGERIAVLMRPAATRLAVALAQTDEDARRLRDSGVRDVQVLGNLKFDMTPAPALLAAGRDWRRALRRPVVMFAASREGEEVLLLDAWRRTFAMPSAAFSAPAAPAAAANAPPPLLLIVPRHPQRFDEVAALVAARGLTLARRSAWGAAVPERPPAEACAVDVWLGDSMGEMPLYYATADLALLGGSFAPLGGQNLIEAAACGCPLLMGPHTFNFAQAAEGALAAGAAERAPDLDAAVARAHGWLADAAALAERADRSTTFAASHRGAAERMAAAVLARIPTH
ncbi:MAG: 3-deoxy-D-manno-octulosonic acid transferase [Rubrivivax sp.]|nr:3-deoxy-D-manno-octulosonic acid transferase [Rubrivivax sp.]